jgi:CRISPR system Cascade subunit CasA
MAEFSLIEEKWIPCARISSEKADNNDLSGEIEDLSLRQVLTEANRIEEIVGENPLVTISLYRLLLAILHDCLQGPKDCDEWAKWRQSESFDADKLNDYFSENESNFFLFDDEKPFYQTTQVSLEEKFLKPMWKLFLEGESFATTFEHTNKEKNFLLKPAQTARLLISFQNFDVGGLQTYIHEKGMTDKEKNTVKSADAALLNKCAVALIKGGNLFETLMLNLTQYDCSFGIPFPKREIRDLPAWKNNGNINPMSDRKPIGYVDLLTWQSRQIRLKLSTEAGEKFVEKVVVMKGDQLADLSILRGREQMAAFRKDVNRGWLPIYFQRERVLWRDSLSLFQTVGETSSRPETLTWIDNLVRNGKLSEDAIFPVDFFGLCVRRANPLFWRHERLPLPVAYLSNQKLCDELGEVLKLVEIVAKLLWRSVDRMAIIHFLPELRFEYPDWFNANLPDFKKRETEEKFSKYRKGKEYKKKFGDADDLTKSLAPELRYWSRLETPFRRLLLALAKDFSKRNEEREKWADELEKTALLSFGEVAFSLGNSPRSLRAVSIARSWLETELRRRKKRYANFEKLEDNIENQEQEEVEE